MALLGSCSSDPAAQQSASSPTGVAADDEVAIGGFAGGFDQVTQRFRVRSEDLQSRGGDIGGDVQRIVELYGELRDIAADARSEYGQLQAPTAVQSVHQQILQLFDRQVRLLDEVVSAAQDDDQSALAGAVQGLVDLTDEFDVARRAMESAIAECGRECIT